MDLSTAATILTNAAPPSFRYERALALAALSGAIVWPRDEPAANIYQLATVNQIIREFQRRSSSFNLTDISGLLMEVDTRFLGSAIAHEIGTLSPDLSFLDFKPSYDHSRYLRDIVRFLLSYRRSKSVREGGATLEKAWLFVNYVGFSDPQDIDIVDIGAICPSYSLHSQIWPPLRRMASLHFVWHLSVRPTIPFDYRRKDFLEKLDRASNDQDFFRSFFGRALWVQSALRKRIGNRSVGINKSFQFPKAVRPEELIVPEFPSEKFQRFERLHRYYLSNDKRVPTRRDRRGRDKIFLDEDAVY